MPFTGEPLPSEKHHLARCGLEATVPVPPAYTRPAGAATTPSQCHEGADP